MISLFLLVFKVARLPIAVIAGVPVVLLLAVHGQTNVMEILIKVVPIVLVTMAGFVLNDLFDRLDDAARGSEKPIATGAISVRFAEAFLATLLIASVVAAVATAVRNSALVVGVTIVGVTAYSFLARRVPFSKGAITACLCCAPFLYASELTDVRFPLSYYACLIVFILGRELLLDTRDLLWDRMARIKTLAQILGERESTVFGWLLMGGSLIALIAQSRGWAQITFFVALFSFVASLGLYRFNRRYGLAASRITLLLATIAASVSV